MENEIAHQIARRADATTVSDVARFGRNDVPPGRDKAVGVPVVLCPRGRLFRLREHSHAAVARAALTEAGAPFDADFPDRTLGRDHGWALVQAAGSDGLRVQIDRAPTRPQRQVIEDLMLYAARDGRPVELQRGRPRVWIDDAWAENPEFMVATDRHAARRLLTRG